ncbi:MAG: prepilin-type N-terminal cleavage/methylation domain-containing protein [Desulfuromonas sp.]|nr:prepilin-type N-terminal cleavage/methylation domain-containing protein [Desulfuromonas sp.]
MNDRIRYSSTGFTLIELIVVIVIIGILAPMGGMLISRPVQSYIDMARRTELVDQAEMSLRRMQRDIRAAVPNSVRISSDGKRLELYYAVDGGRYRLKLASDGSGDPLDFLAADSSFDVPGGLQHFGEVQTGDKVVVYNLSATGENNIYSGDNCVGVDKANSSANKLKLTAAKQFLLQSNYQRFFIADEPVCYVISDDDGDGDGELCRHADYPSNATSITPVASLSGGVLVAQHIVLADSAFSYAAGSAQRGGLVTLQLALEREGERITLLHQVHVDNSP